MTSVSEATVEAADLEWLAELGSTLQYGPDIAPNRPAPERRSYAAVVLLPGEAEKVLGRLR